FRRRHRLLEIKDRRKLDLGTNEIPFSILFNQGVPLEHLLEFIIVGQLLWLGVFRRLVGRSHGALTLAFYAIDSADSIVDTLYLYRLVIVDIRRVLVERRIHVLEAIDN